MGTSHTLFARVGAARLGIIRLQDPSYVAGRLLITCEGKGIAQNAHTRGSVDNVTEEHCPVQGMHSTEAQGDVEHTQEPSLKKRALPAINLSLTFTLVLLVRDDHGAGGEVREGLQHEKLRGGALVCVQHNLGVRRKEVGARSVYLSTRVHVHEYACVCMYVYVYKRANSSERISYGPT